MTVNHKMNKPAYQAADNNGVCPRCHQPGRPVPVKTVRAMVLPEVLAVLKEAGSYSFCPTPNCEVVYFNNVTGETICQDAVRVSVFQKSTDPKRLVCYCFGYTVEAVESEVRAHGVSSILEDIKAKCAKGLNDCERNNPQGTCCLGNVQQLVQAAGDRSGPAQPGRCCCCGSEQSGTPVTPDRK